MARPRPLFRERDATRLVRAYVKAGLPPPAIRITKATGDLIAIPADSAAVKDEGGELDRWLKEHHESPAQGN